MKEQKKVNPLATESEGKLIAKFAIPAIISMLVSSLYNIVDQFFIGRSVGELGNAATNVAFPLSTSCVALCRLSVRQQHFFLESEVRRILICVPEREIMRKQAGLRGPGFPCW
mgnify:CR=1 FL=1